MIFEANHPASQMLWGNLLLVACCVFYLLWWVLAFKPTGAIKGFKSGWLLIPAVILGIAAVVLIIKGSTSLPTVRSFFSPGVVLVAAIAAYIALLAVTQIAFHRQVTTELFLIVGWTALVLLEGNALYGAEIITQNSALILFAAATLIALLSMVCYLLYYGLGTWAGYVDGMIPLLLVAIYMALLSIVIAHGGS